MGKKEFLRYLKLTKCEEFKNYVKILKEGIDAHSEVISEARKSIQFNVVDVDKAENWKLGCGGKRLNEILDGGMKMGGVDEEVMISDDEDVPKKKRKNKKRKSGGEEEIKGEVVSEKT